VGYNIGLGVIRRSRVVGPVLRVFLVTFLYVKSDVQIARQCRYLEICQASSRRQNARFDWINKHGYSDLAQMKVSFINQVPRCDRMSENEKVELFRYSQYNLEGSMSS
jgi:hypothetical protein